MIVVDIETTGLDVTRSGLLSIGAVDIKRPDDVFYGECKLEKGKLVDSKALEYNGFKLEQINDSKKQSQTELINKFAQWVARSRVKVLAGENPAMLDFPMLKLAFKAAKQKWPFGHRTIDLHSVSYCHHLENGLNLPEKNSMSELNLDATLEHVGLPPEPRPHHGRNGAKLEAEAFNRLLFGKKLFDDYRAYQLPDYLKK